MARVEWTRLEPGDTEHVVAIMLARENPSAQRIRPSRGDHGIDVLVSDADRAVDVYQVKSFHENLTAGQKAQIAESLKSLRKWLAEKQATIRHWYLVMPLDPTPENLEWLKNLTAEDDFECEWRGLNYVEGLAAKYPDVIDYYLRDGKEQLAAAVAALTDLLRSAQRVADGAGQPGGPLTPEQALVGLGALYDELNRYDPHYRYDFSVDATCPEVPDQHMLVFATQFGDGRKCITFRVFARFREAVEERPVPIRFGLKLDPSSETAEQFRDWLTYGAPFHAPLGSADIVADLPGGLGGELKDAAITLGPSEGGKPYELRLELVAPSGEVLASARIKMNPVTIGVTQKGFRASGTEEHGVFDIEIRATNPLANMAFSVSSKDITGTRPPDVLAGVRFLAHFRAPNALRFAAPFGTATGEPMPIPADSGPPDKDADVVLRIVEALVTIQEHATAQIVVPDLTEMTRREAGTLVRAARLLRGESIKAKWKPITARAPADHLLPTGAPKQPSWDEPLVVFISGAKIELGRVRIQAHAAHVEVNDSTVDANGCVAASFSPFDGDDEATMKFITQEEKTTSA